MPSDEMMNDKRDVFISYHTNSSSEQVKNICAVLESRGISCWYAPRNVKGEFASSIIEAIRNCRVFLIILNSNSNVSEHVLNELNYAFDRLSKHENIELLPFRVDDSDLSDSVQYYLGRMHVMDGSLPPEMLRIQELADRISLILGKVAERSAEIPDRFEDSSRFGSPVTYRLTGTMVYPDSHFVGRSQELRQIHEGLSGVENKIFIVGMGGIGKSEVARMYIKMHRDDYDVILWASFDGSIEQTLINDYAFQIQGLSRNDFPEDSDSDYFRRKLRILKEIADRKVLIIIDNFDVSDDPRLEDFCSAKYSVIFTTRYHQDNTRIPEVEIKEMTDETELLELFKSEYKRWLDEKGTEYVKDIIRQLNGHTLSIRLAASAMQHRRISPEKMSELLRNGRLSHEKSNSSVEDMIYRQIKQVFDLSTLSEEEEYLLKNLVLIPISGMSVELFYEWCGAEDYDVIDGLIKKSWVIHNPVTDEIHLHPLIADIFAERLADDPHCCDRLLDTLLDSVEYAYNTSFAYKQKLLDIANSAYERLPAGHSKLYQVIKSQARISMDMCQYEERCEKIYNKLLEAASDLGEKLYVYNKLAHIKILSGMAKEGVEIAEKGYALVKDVDILSLSPEERYDYLEILRRLVEANRDIGNYDEAIRYGRKCVSYKGDFYGPYSSTEVGTYGWSEYHLARALYMNGELDESEERMNHAIELFDEDKDEWSKSFCYEILGQIEMKRGNFDKALEFSKKAYDILLPLLCEDHRDIASNNEWRSNIYFAMGDEKRGKECLEKAAAIYRKLNFTKLEQKVLDAIKAVEKEST